MMSDLRVRRHTDGHVALSMVPHVWKVTNDASWSWWATDGDVSGEGWSELLVAELPELDRDRTPTQAAYDAACAALWRHRDRAGRLEAALRELVELKDGPRDEQYRGAKEVAWQNAREILRQGEV